MKKIPPVHPGEILEEDFLKPMGLSQYRLAKDIGVPARRVMEQELAGVSSGACSVKMTEPLR